MHKLSVTQGSTMKNTDIRRLFYAHLLCVLSVILSTFVPSFFLESFSILETHLTWLGICSVSVTAVNLVLYLVVKPNVSSKRSSSSHKVGVGNIFVRSYFVYLHYCTLFMFVGTKSQSMAKSFQ
uniref:Phosphatidylinositol glycan anchor biosynthesis class F n=1 Tax=Oryctolagus cuniculus TaxID=9986 RepID=A0A5F9C5Q4_RABIT